MRGRLIVAGAFSLLLLHNADEAFVHPESGGTVNLAETLIVGVLIVGFYPRIGRGWRVGLLGLVGAVAAVLGLMSHVGHLFTGTAVPLDWSGILFMLGGLVLLGMSIAEFQSACTARFITPQVGVDP